MILSFFSCGIFFYKSPSKKENSLSKLFLLFGNLSSSNKTTQTIPAPVEDVFSVLATSPVADSVNIKISDRVVASFNHELDSVSVTSSSFIVKQDTVSISGTIQTYSNTILFFPEKNFSYNTKYTVTIAASISDNKGKALSSDYVFYFTSEQSPDTTSPTLLSSTPLQGETGVSVYNPITLNFSKEIQTDTINLNSISISCSGKKQYGNFQIQAKTISFYPSGNFLPNSDCEYNVTTSLKDNFGNSLDKNYSASFTTQDNAPPYIVSIDPKGRSVGHLITDPIKVTFSKEIDLNSVNSNSFQLISSISGIISGSFSFSNNTLIFTPSSPLNKKERYSVLLTTLIKDLNGNPIPSTYIYDFITEVPMMIAAGYSHVCALSKKGRIKCWGSNAYGQSGQGDDVFNQLTPKEIPFDLPALEVYAGFFSACALFSNLKLKCWGYNGTGALGNFPGIVRNPVQNQYIALQFGILKAATSLQNTCVISTNQKVYCWGLKGSSGLDWSISSELILKDPYILTDLNLGASAIDLSLGINGAVSCAILSSGKLKCWGYKENGQIGLPLSSLTAFSNYVYPASSVSDYYASSAYIIKSISVGNTQICSLFVNGYFRCWGWNSSGEIYGASIGDIIYDATSALLYDLGSNPMQLFSGFMETYAIDGSGNLMYWGKNSNGNIKAIPLSDTAIAMTGGAGFGCAILQIEQIQCWGRNDMGQLGNGNTMDISYETPNSPITLF